MTVAVTLVTCDRLGYTRRTVETFAALNDMGRFVLLHADDASTDASVFPLVQSHGFETVKTPAARQGAQATRRTVVREAAARGADWVLMLENDWESDRPFPWALLEFVSTRQDIYCLRLLGAFKERDSKRPFFRMHVGKNGRPRVEWKPLDGAPEPAEVGSVHYGSPPNVARMEQSLWLHEQSDSDRMAAYKSGRIGHKTARVVNNVFFHIGEARTPEFAA